MSLASTVPSTAYAGTHSHAHYNPNTSFLKLSSKFKFRHNPWRHKPLSVISQVISTNTDIETTPGNPSVADQHKPFVKDTKPCAKDTHNLKQGLSKSKSKWVNPSNRKEKVITKENSRSSNPQAATLNLFLNPLNSCKPTQKAIFEALDFLQETPNPRDAKVIMNNIQDWKKGYYFFQWLNKNEDFQMDTVIYNVTMKVLRRGRQWNRVEELLKNMLVRGIQPDNITFSTVISCARLCNLPQKAVKWFERMNETGCEPNEVTYTAMIDAYSRAGKVQEALNLYERARANGWIPDIKAFGTLLKMYNLCGDYDGVLYTFQEMKALGVKPSLVAYNTMFDSLAKLEKPSMAKALFKEMTDAGLAPDQITMTCLLRIYVKAKWADSALKLWGKIKEEGWNKDLILYNTLLGMCADIGFVEEAVRLFEEMQQKDDCKPDHRTYISMIDLYASGGQTEEADRMFNEMMEAGFKPSVVVCTCLIQCYGRAKRFDDVVRTFNLLLGEGILPDDKFCGSLLSVLTLCEEEELGKVLGCIEKVNPKLGLVVKMLQDKDISLEVLEKEVETALSEASFEVHRPFCNCLIDLCYKFNFPERSHNLLTLGIECGVYTNLYMNSPTQWCLNLRSLSFKAALTAFDDWISNLSEAAEDGIEMPPLLGIHTGHGNHKYSSDKSLVALFEPHLRELESPFQKSTERAGWFLATSDEAISWLQSRNPSILISA